jgi:hypothetical protein
MATDIPSPLLGSVPDPWHRENFVDVAPMGGEWTCAALLTSGAAAGTAVKLDGVTAAKGDANGFTIGTDQTITATFYGTRLCRVHCILDIDIATGTDNVTLHVFVGGVSVFETAAISVVSSTLELFEIDVLLEIANGDTIEIYAENEDAAVEVDAAAAVERIDTLTASGFCRVSSA